MAAVALGLLVLGALLWGKPDHPRFFWDRVPAFAAVFGLAGAAALVALARLLGRLGLERPEDYYECR